MNPVDAPWATCIAAGVFAAACLAFLGRIRLYRPAPEVDAGWPWWVRLPFRPAAMLVPRLERVMGEAIRQRLRRRLEAADLFPGITPEQWVALRVLHGAAAAIALACIAIAAEISLLFPVCVGALAGSMLAGWWLRQALAEAERCIVRDLPAYLDLLTVCVEAGATLTAGVRLIVQEAPPGPLRSYFDRVLREVRSGRRRSQAFISVATACNVESLQTLASALAHAESSGMSLGQVLRSQSEQRNAERFVRAERLAMLAPVKMLGPLILCIFPCTFIVLAVPVVHRLAEEFSR